MGANEIGAHLHTPHGAVRAGRGGLAGRRPHIRAVLLVLHFISRPLELPSGPLDLARAFGCLRSRHPLARPALLSKPKSILGLPDHKLALEPLFDLHAHGLDLRVGLPGGLREHLLMLALRLLQLLLGLLQLRVESFILRGQVAPGLAALVPHSVELLAELGGFHFQLLRAFPLLCARLLLRLERLHSAVLLLLHSPRRLRSEHCKRCCSMFSHVQNHLHLFPDDRGVERLRNEVSGAALEPVERGLVLGGLRGDHDDGQLHMRRLILLAHGLADLEAAHAWHLDVQKHQVRRRLALLLSRFHILQRLMPAHGDGDIAKALEGAQHHLLVDLVVVHRQHQGPLAHLVGLFGLALGCGFGPGHQD
mmetsp:Transcript_26458/g.76369  ORF Transcript_26458/g.76369 Transcript_26458/m.76369 type:complete len:364 (+) Transcript_26458:390-1481(+)